MLFYFVSPAQMGNAWWLLPFITIMSFHRLHNPFFLNGQSFSLRASFCSLGQIFMTLMGINDVLITFFLLYFSHSLSHWCTFIFSVWLIQPRGHIGGITGSQRGCPWSFFSLVQDRSGLPASLLRQHRAIHKSLSKHLPASMGCVMGPNRRDVPLLFIMALLLYNKAN